MGELATVEKGDVEENNYDQQEHRAFRGEISCVIHKGTYALPGNNLQVATSARLVQTCSCCVSLVVSGIERLG